MGAMQDPHTAILKALDEGGIDPTAVYEGLPPRLRDSLDKSVRNEHKKSFIWLSPDAQKREIAKFLVIVGKANLIAGALAGARAKHAAAGLAAARPSKPRRLQRLLILVALLSLLIGGFFLWTYREAVIRQIAGAQHADSQADTPRPLAPEIQRNSFTENGSLPSTEEAGGSDEQNLVERQPDDTDTDAWVIETTQSVGDVDRFSARLASYARQYPDTPRSADFGRALDEALPLVRRIDAWNALLNTWERLDLSNLTHDAVREQIQTATVYLDSCGELPGADGLRRRMDVMMAIAGRFDQEGHSIVTSLLERFRQPEMSLKFVLKTIDGRRYYFDEQPVLQDGIYQIKAVVALPPAPSQAVQVPRSELDGAASGHSPHGAIAADVAAALSKVSPQGWEEAFLTAIRAIVHADSKLDPLLRIAWLKQVLYVGTTGSVPLSEAFQKHSAHLKDLQIPQDLEWWNSDSDPVNMLRNECEKLLADLPNVQQAIRSVDRTVEQLQVPRRVEWVGWLHGSDNGQWECPLRDAERTRAGPLLAVSKSGPPENRLTLEEIGDVKEGIAVLNTQDQESFYQGRPVFAVTASQP